MIEQIEVFFRDFISALQIARLYTANHPRFNKFIDKAYASLEEILREKEDLVIGIIAGELAFEKEILFDLSKSLKTTITYLRNKGIERLAFYRGITKEELSQFIAFLAASRDQAKIEAQEYLAQAGIKHIAAGKIHATLEGSKDQLKRPGDYLGIFEDSSSELSRTQDMLLKGETLDDLSLRFILNSVLENLISQEKEMLSLTTLKRYDLGTFSHSLNTSILSMYFTSQLGFAKADCLDIGLAAIFHDIGKLSISRKIIQKPAGLSKEEFSEMQNHVIEGTGILLKYTDHLGILPVVVCFEHHLRYDLSGYPKKSLIRTLHIASLIVALCDVYDSLCQRRNYKSDYPPELIYHLIIKESGRYFHPRLTEMFFKVMGVWPRGVVVLLSDKRVAVVKEENEDDIFSPKVEVISPEEKKELVDLKTTKATLKIEKFLNPWKEGKDFLKK